ncbi:MAG TPA: cytochrome P460 family protein [Blastocatellia bacterium]
MKRITSFMILGTALVGIIVSNSPASDVPTSSQADGQAAPIYGIRIPAGYRDWPLISVAHEEGNLDDIRAILGNETAIKAYREGDLPFPDGTAIARVAWSYVPSDEDNKVFGRAQSFVAGPPKNGVQFMVKDSKKYASTGGWGFAQFDDGKPASETVIQTCFPCHQAASRDFVFTRYAR